MTTRADDVRWLQDVAIPPDADCAANRWGLLMMIGLRIQAARAEQRECPELIEMHNVMRRSISPGTRTECDGWRDWQEEQQENDDTQWERNQRADTLEQEPIINIDIGV